MSSARRSLPILVAVLFSMSLGFVLLMSTGQDDPYLSFWPAYTLAYHGEIANYNGQRVEQSSSLLHTLVLAISARTTGVALPTAGYWIGVLAGVLAMIRAASLSSRLGEPASFGLLLLVGSCPAFLYWCFGGLETPLVSWLLIEVALVGAGIIAGRIGPLSPQVVLVSFAYVAVRPEGAIVLGSTLLVWLGLHGWGQRGGVPGEANAAGVRRWLLVVVLLVVLLCAFRVVYFGSLVPQPVAAKVGGEPLGRIRDGFEYLTQLVRRPWASTLAFVLTALPFVLWRELRQRDTDWVKLFSWLLVGASTAFILFAGGDWMKGARFVAQFAPLGIVLGYVVLRASPMPARWASAVVVVLIVFQLAGLLALAYSNYGRPLWEFSKVDAAIREHSGDGGYTWIERANRIRTRDILFLAHATETVERILGQQERVVVMSGQAGMVFYYLAKRFYGRVEFVDRFGLSTTHLSRVGDELDLRSGPQGLWLPMERFFVAAEQRPEPAWSPDLVFDIYDTRERRRALRISRRPCTGRGLSRAPAADRVSALSLRRVDLPIPGRQGRDRRQARAPTSSDEAGLACDAVRRDGARGSLQNTPPRGPVTSTETW
jgi:hypothetical protein